MEPGQEWCLQCGAGVPGSLVTRSPSWRSTTTIVIATVVLVLGAATAAYAALTKSTPARQLTATVTTTPTATTPTATTPATPGTTPAPATTPTVPAATVKPPKIPITAATPKSTPTPATPPASTTPPPAIPKVVAPKANTPASTPKSEPTPILLDTNAVSTYNPNAYPEDSFGDPSLTIDGDTATDWTARVDPAIAPKMAAGLLVDLKTAQRLSALLLVSSTPGMTVQILGANGTAAPTTVTDPGWTKLTQAQVEKKRHARIALGQSSTAFRFVLFWITGVPAGSVGTAEAPGRVSVNELELVPVK
jgi:hypothetical protein